MSELETGAAVDVTDDVAVQAAADDAPVVDEAAAGAAGGGVVHGDRPDVSSSGCRGGHGDRRGRPPPSA